jgi:hypothetical protein
MYIQIGNDFTYRGVEIDIHDSFEGGGWPGHWVGTRPWESAEADADNPVTFRIFYSIKVSETGKKDSYRVKGAVFAVEMKSDKEISSGTVTEVSSTVTLGEPFEIDTGMTFEDKSVTLKLLLKSKM